MNPNLCRVVLRPRGPLEVFDLGIRLVASQPGPFLWLLLATVLPAFLLFAPAAWWFSDRPELVAVLVMLGAIPLQAPFTVLGGRMLFQADVSAKDVLRETLSMVPRSIGVWMVQLMALVVGLPLCGIGWVFFAVPTLFVAETALLERVDFGRMLRRSSRLASAHPGSVAAGVCAQLGLLVWMVVVVEGTGHALLATVLQLGAPFGSLFTGTMTPWAVLGVLLAQPVYALYRILLYVDVRTRVEGWDLQVRLRAAGLQ